MTRAEDVRVAYPLFQAGGGGSSPTSALQLWFQPCSAEVAKRLTRAWHSRLPRLSMATCRVCYSALYEDRYFAAAVWANPSSAMLDQTWLELKRFSIAPDAPKNTATRMLGWMVRDIIKRFPDVPRLISYQDPAVHKGTIYRAANWTCTGARPSGGFASAKTRYRKADQAPGPKVRWEKVIR